MTLEVIVHLVFVQVLVTYGKECQTFCFLIQQHHRQGYQTIRQPLLAVHRGNKPQVVHRAVLRLFFNNASPYGFAAGASAAATLPSIEPSVLTQSTIAISAVGRQTALHALYDLHA